MSAIAYKILSILPMVSDGKNFYNTQKLQKLNGKTKIKLG